METARSCQEELSFPLLWSLLYLFSYPAAVLCWLLRLSFNIPYCITQHTSDYTTHYIQYNIPQGALEKGMIGWMLSSVLCQIRKTSRSLIIIETIKHFIKQKSALDHRADIDMKAFPPISGWNNKLILAGSFIENNGRVLHQLIMNDWMILYFGKKKKFFIKFEEFKNCKQDIVNW